MLVAGCGFRKLHIISWKTVRYLRIPNRLFSAFVKIRMSRMPILPIIGIEDIRFVIKSGIIIISPRTFNLNRVSHCSLRFYYTLHKTIACAWIGFVQRIIKTKRTVTSLMTILARTVVGVFCVVTQRLSIIFKVPGNFFSRT